MWRSLWLQGLLCFCLAFAGSCTTPPLTSPKRPVTRAPSSALPEPTPSTATEAQPLALRPPLDPSVIDQEIQRRKKALELARDQLDQIPPGPEKEPLASWIRVLEQQMRRLESLRETLVGWSSSAEPEVADGMNERVAALLLECLTLDPLKPPEATATAPPSITEETRLSWEPVRSAYGQGDCTEALAKYEALSRTHPLALIPADVQILRALCLGRAGNRQEAIQILEPLLLGQAHLVDAQYLQYLLANWLFQEGLLDRADVTYRSLLEGIKERNRWADLADLRLLQIRLRLGESAPAGPTLASAEPQIGKFPKTEPSSEAGPSAERKLSTGPPFLQGEGETSEQPPSMASATPSIMEARAARLEEAQRLLESERYGQAIAAFQDLLGTEYETLAQEGIQQTQDRYAEKRRREAADLVLKAHNETKRGKRKDLLVQALGILSDTNNQYPGNRYAAKIDKNIRDVVAQIQGIDPDFQPQAPGQQPKEQASSPPTLGNDSH